MTVGSTWLVLIVLALGAGFYFFQGQLGFTEPVAEVSFEKIAEGEDATIPKRVNYRIKSAEELTQLWDILGLSSPLPAVDFSQKEVAAVFAGVAQHDIGVIKVVDTAEQRVFSIELQKSDEECTPSDMSPYELIAVPKTTLSLTHEDREVMAACPEAN